MSDLALGSLCAEHAHGATEAGSALPVVLVHGLGGSTNTFEPLTAALGERETLRVDLPGAARSGARGGEGTLERLVVAVRELMDAAGIARAHLVGHSLGTLVCQHLAVARAERVASLALYGPLLEPPVAARQALRERAARARREGLAGIATEVARASLSARSRRESPAAHAFVRESLMRQSPDGYARHCEALATARAADAERIRCPALLVVGSDDPVTPPAMASALARRLPEARVETLDGVGHWATIERPERASALLRDWLAALES